MIEDWSLDQAIYAIGYRVLGYNYLIGSGFRAHYSDVIWTNAHVAEGLSDVITNLAILGPTPFAVKSGTVIFGPDTHILETFFVHPEYNGSTLSPDVAFLLVGETESPVPAFIPQEFADDLRVGEPIGTIGFPGEVAGINTTVPIGTFKDGTISALRPYSPNTPIVSPANNKMVQHNLDLSGGTSGSPIFDHLGWIIAVNNSGTEELVIDAVTGEPARVPTGNIGFGIRADEVWSFIDWLGSGKPIALPKPVPPRWPRGMVGYHHEVYQPFPPNWDGTTILP